MIKIRKKIFNKIAQEADATTETETTVQLGTPPTFSASGRYPSLRIAFNTPGAINIIDNLSSFLSNAIFYASNGKFDMEKLFQIKFNFGATDVTDRNVRFLMLLAKEIYNIIYNKGENYQAPLTKEQFLEKLNQLKNSQSVSNLSTTSTMLSSKMGADVKASIINYFTALSNATPTK